MLIELIKDEDKIEVNSVAKAIELIIKKYTIKNKQQIDYISKFTTKIPLYNIRKEKIKFIDKEKCYDYTLNKHYRFPFKIKRDILKNFNLEILYQNYKNAIYDYVVQNITTCADISVFNFQVNQEPYFPKDVLTNLSKVLDVNDNCESVIKKTFTKDIILKHTKYIIKNKGMYIIRFYSFNGDLYMNKYLRNLSGRQKKNLLIENSISILWNLIRGAPALDKDYTVFRLIDSDDHLKNLKINDIYEIEGFISTTRDPFYLNSEYDLGDIIIKIHVPKNVKGIALLLELFSPFQEENEVLFAPKTKFKLIRKNWKYYHHNKNIEANVKMTYEFEFVDIQPVKYSNNYVPLLKGIPKNNLDEITVDGISIQQKLLDFKKHTNISQFKSIINGTKYHFFIRYYDSVNIYSQYYFFKTAYGLAINLQNKNNGQICAIFEIGIDSVHINYKMNFFDGDDCNMIPDEDILSMANSLKRIFSLEKIVIYCTTVSCLRFYKNNNSNLTEFMYQKNKYNKDIYDYLKNNIIRFPNARKSPHKYIDKLKIPLPSILHGIYPNVKSLADFYVAMIENDCYKIKKYIHIIQKYYEKNVEINPLNFDLLKYTF